MLDYEGRKYTENAAGGKESGGKDSVLPQVTGTR
jgi:hypothetical protein